VTSGGKASGRRWRLLAWICLALIVLLGALAWLARQSGRPYPMRAITGAISRTLCSGAFVSLLNPEQVYAATLRPGKGFELVDWAIRYRVDAARGEVTTSFLGMFESTAVFRERLGCLLLRGDAQSSRSPAPPSKESAEAVGAEYADQRLREPLERAFAESDASLVRRTAAVVVLRDGRVMAERYAPGYRADTPLLGYSVTKSVVSALIGILVRDGRMTVAGPAPVAEWRDPADPRHALTIDHLLRMTSGLDLDETNRDYDSVTRMLMMERDMAGFAASAALAAQPGTKWEYTSGNTLILSRIIRDAVGGRAEDVLEFARRELFAPLGMRNVTLEFDASGTPIGSTYMYASARDWARFGMLFADHGVSEGRRILPEGWVRYSASQTLESPYAAGFWLGSKSWRARWKIPPDAFFASGFLGQRVMIVPSMRLVIARFGNAHGRGYDIDGFGRLVSDVVETYRN
jgi:CubicO group peptidase (beta-lactamase class C family)